MKRNIKKSSSPVHGVKCKIPSPCFQKITPCFFLRIQLILLKLRCWNIKYCSVDFRTTYFFCQIWSYFTFPETFNNISTIITHKTPKPGLQLSVEDLIRTQWSSLHRLIRDTYLKWRFFKDSKSQNCVQINKFEKPFL